MCQNMPCPARFLVNIQRTQIILAAVIVKRKNIMPNCKEQRWTGDTLKFVLELWKQCPNPSKIIRLHCKMYPQSIKPKPHSISRTQSFYLSLQNTVFPLTEPPLPTNRQNERGNTVCILIEYSVTCVISCIAIQTTLPQLISYSPVNFTLTMH